MATIGIVHCTDVMLSNLLSDEPPPDGERTFAFPVGLWIARWHLAVFIRENRRDNSQQIVGLGAMHPGRRVADFERTLRVANFNAVNPAIPLDGLLSESKRDQEVRRALSRSGPLITGNNQPDARGRRLIEVLRGRGLEPILDDLFARINAPQPSGIRGETLSQERDAYGTLLEVSGWDRLEELRELLWIPDTPPNVPFLGRTQTRRTDEDHQIAHDYLNLFDWRSGPTAEQDWRVFRRRNSRGSIQQLFVYNANRTPAEQTLGVDMIYLNELHMSYVMVQYKKLHKERNKWAYRPTGDHNLRHELERMAKVDDECAKAIHKGPADLRLLCTPCLIKLCKAEAVSPMSGELVRGMYLPRAAFAELVDHPVIQGPRGGPRFTFENVPRYLDNTTFTYLLSNGWIGSRGTGTRYVAEQVQRSLDAGRAVMAGFHS